MSLHIYHIHTSAARLIAWLVTDDARWITGEVINSTGGML